MRSSRMSLFCAALGPEIFKHFLAVKRGELDVLQHPCSRLGAIHVSGVVLAMVDFSTTRVWDVHAHPFLDRGQVSADDFVRLTAFGGGAEEYFAQAGIEPTAEI